MNRSLHSHRDEPADAHQAHEPRKGHEQVEGFALAAALQMIVMGAVAHERSNMQYRIQGILCGKQSRKRASAGF